MEDKRQAESKKEERLQLEPPSDPREVIKTFEKSLEGLENMVKLFRSDVSKMFDIFDPKSSDSEIEIEEATKLKEYLIQSHKPIIDTGSDLTILSEDYAKCLGAKIVPISPINASLEK